MNSAVYGEGERMRGHSEQQQQQQQPERYDDNEKEKRKTILSPFFSIVWPHESVRF